MAVSTASLAGLSSASLCSSSRARNALALRISPRIGSPSSPTIRDLATISTSPALHHMSSIQRFPDILHGRLLSGLFEGNAHHLRFERCHSPRPSLGCPLVKPQLPFSL